MLENIWDQEWRKVVVDKTLLDIEMKSEIVRRVMSILEKEFGTLKNSNIAELGSGLGRVSLYLSLLGANTTLIDSSAVALEKAKELFQLYNKEPRIINIDLLKDDNELKKLKNKFDIAMSWGLVEHFVGNDRKKVFDLHFQLTRPGGICVISLPNRYCPPYQFFMKLSKFLGKWRSGIEVPFTKNEIKNLIKRNRVEDWSICTSSLIESINRCFLGILRRQLEKRALNKIANLLCIPDIKLGFLDRFGHALVVIAKKLIQDEMVRQ